MNLRAALTGAPPVRYRPQRSALALLATGDDRAILAWHGLAAEGVEWCIPSPATRTLVVASALGADRSPLTRCSAPSPSRSA